MNFYSLYSDRILASGFLISSGKPYTCQLLDETHLPAVMKLQTTVIEGLASSQRNFILPKTAAEFSGFLTKEKGLMVGVIMEGRLIAQGLLYWPTDTGPGSGMTDCPNWPGSAAKSAVIMGMLVDPQERGNNLQQILQQVRVNLAKRYNRQEILGETSAANAFSLVNAIQAGAYVVSAGRDPEDGCQLLNFRFSHTHQPQLTQKPATTLSLATQFNQISRALATGKVVGVGVTPDKSLIMRTHNGWKPKPAQQQRAQTRPAGLSFASAV